MKRFHSVFVLMVALFAFHVSAKTQDFNIEGGNEITLRGVEHKKKFVELLEYRFKVMETGLDVLSGQIGEQYGVELSCGLKRKNYNVPDPVRGTFWGYRPVKWSWSYTISCQSSDLINVESIRFFEGHRVQSALDDCLDEPTRLLLEIRDNNTPRIFAAQAHLVYDIDDHDNVLNPINSNPWQLTEYRASSGWGILDQVCW